MQRSTNELRAGTRRRQPRRPRSTQAECSLRVGITAAASSSVGIVRAHAYVDGFNLYHGALERRPHCKWLDLRALCEHLLPRDEVRVVRYFTARVGASDADPGQPQRQDVYLRALTGLDRVVLHEGHFQVETRRLPRAGSDPMELVDVRVPEEKGSDVNLATHLMLDAAFDEMEAALVVSDDHDLEEPLRVVRNTFGIRLVVASPRNRNKLQRAVGADERKTLHEDLLVACQLPDPQYDEDFHLLHRPASWQGP
jgi:hypothetical protein